MAHLEVLAQFGEEHLRPVPVLVVDLRIRRGGDDGRGVALVPDDVEPLAEIRARLERQLQGAQLQIAQQKLQLEQQKWEIKNLTKKLNKQGAKSKGKKK